MITQGERRRSVVYGQLWLATIHATAVLLALSWAATHALATVYHLRRVRELEQAA